MMLTFTALIVFVPMWFLFLSLSGAVAVGSGEHAPRWIEARGTPSIWNI